MNTMKSVASLAAMVTLGLTLSACGGTASSSPTAPSAEAVTSQPEAAKGPEKSARGNIVKKLGEGASITDSMTPGNPEVVNFTINSITPGACTEPYAQPPVNGNIFIVDVTVETKPELANAMMKSYSMSGYDFKYIAPNGTTFNGDLGTMATYGCLPDSATFPSAGMGPAEKITAKVVLDVPQPSGILVLKAPLSNTMGWEYTF